MLYIYEKPIDVSGLWITNLLPLTLLQHGNKVLGKYDLYDGILEGTLNGNVLTGTWMQSKALYDECNYGPFEFEFSKNSFKGSWGYCDTKELTGRLWSGSRISR